LGVLELYRPKDFSDRELNQLKPVIDNFARALRGCLDHHRILSEIRERKKTEASLRESEEKYRDLVELAQDGIAILQDGRTRFVNRRMAHLADTSVKKMLGVNFLNFVAPGERPRLADYYRRRLAGETPPAIYETILENGKKKIPAEINAGIITFQGRPAALIFVRDLSERKKLEEDILNARKLESLGVLAGGIAHDFNNILGSIIGCAELIEMLDVPEDSNIRDRLKRILSSAYRAKDLVQQILTFSRRSEQNTAPVALTLIVKEAIKFLRASLPATIKIDVRVDTGNSTVLGDATQLYQVLMNLCTNAAHAMGEKGGLLEVRLRDVDYDSMDSGLKADLKPGPYIMLCVQDTGCGIPTDVVKRIFDPFYTTKRPGEGTGLGLSVVHGIVKSMHGAVSVHTQIGQGSLFRVYLPRQKEKQQNPVSEKIHRIMGGQGCIMFIDDEASLVDFARQILTKLGYEVVAHTSSTQALEQFTQQPEAFDLVVTDLAMPDLPGLQLAESIMRLRPTLPIILCSGFMDPEKVKKARDMGIKEFIMKPFGVREFAQTIRRVLNG